MKPRARSRLLATLIMAGTAAGVWACGAVVPEGERSFRDGGDDGEVLPDGRVIVGFDACAACVDDGFGFDAEPPFDGDFFDGDNFDSGFDSEPFDGEFFDVEPFDGGFFDGDDGDPGDGDFFDSEPAPDAGPPWNGGAPVTLAAGEQPVSLAIDTANVYWENNGGAVADCPLSGCPNNTPTFLVGGGGGFFSESIAAGSSIAFFAVSGSVDSCASGGCSFTPAPYWTEPEFDEGGAGDAGGGFVNDIISDSTNLYFTDGLSVYSCPIASTCSSPTALLTTGSGAFEQLAVNAGDVFYVNDDTATPSLHAVPITGGATRLVCKSDLLWDINSIVASSAYVYFTTGDDSSSIYQCPAAGGGKPTVFASDEFPYGLAADGANLYWTNNANPGVIGTCPLGPACMGSRTVASGQDNPAAIAVNATAVYWTTTTAIRSATK